VDPVDPMNGSSGVGGAGGRDADSGLADGTSWNSCDSRKVRRASLLFSQSDVNFHNYHCPPPLSRPPARTISNTQMHMLDMRLHRAATNDHTDMRSY
jgi:hypothetical protein